MKGSSKQANAQTSNHFCNLLLGLWTWTLAFPPSPAWTGSTQQALFWQDGEQRARDSPHFNSTKHNKDSQQTIGGSIFFSLFYQPSRSKTMNTLACPCGTAFVESKEPRKNGKKWKKARIGKRKKKKEEERIAAKWTGKPLRNKIKCNCIGKSFFSWLFCIPVNEAGLKLGYKRCSWMFHCHQHSQWLSSLWGALIPCMHRC